MPPDPRRIKTQSLSLRLDPKTKFVLDFVARIRGQSITAVMERAIKESADKVGIGPTWDDRGNEVSQHNWTHYWDASEGVRALNLLADPDYPTNFDEDEIRQFTLAHWQFFYTDSAGRAPRRGYIDILWPRVQSFLELWRNTRADDYWAAGKAMVGALRTAKVEPPDWPPPTPKPSPQAQASGDLDEDIPF